MQAPLDCARTRVLLVSADPYDFQQLLQRMERTGFAIDVLQGVRDAVVKLRGQEAQYELVIVDISDRNRLWEKIIHTLQEAASQAHRQLAPLFLCIARSQVPAELRLALELKGARLAYER